MESDNSFVTCSSDKLSVFSGGVVVIILEYGLDDRETNAELSTAMGYPPAPAPGAVLQGEVEVMGGRGGGGIPPDAAAAAAAAG